MTSVTSQFQPVNSGVGFGILDKAATGIVRTAALLTVCNAAMIIGELTIRGLSQVLKSVGLRYEGSVLEKAEAYMPNINIRPYQLNTLEEAVVSQGRAKNVKEAREVIGNMDKDVISRYQAQINERNKNLGWKTLVISGLASAILGVLAVELVSVLGGTTPQIYNNVLGCIGLNVIPTNYIGSALSHVRGIAG